MDAVLTHYHTHYHAHLLLLDSGINIPENIVNSPCLDQDGAEHEGESKAGKPYLHPAHGAGHHWGGHSFVDAKYDGLTVQQNSSHSNEHIDIGTGQFNSAVWVGRMGSGCVDVRRVESVCGERVGRVCGERVGSVCGERVGSVCGERVGSGCEERVGSGCGEDGVCMILLCGYIAVNSY